MLGELETILSGMSTTSNSNFTEIKNLLGTINANASNASSYASSTKSNTTTNNTASETGILSQKLSWLITANKAHGSLERTSAGSQNWTCPTGVYFVFIVLVGGGGGGGGGCSSYRPSYSAGYDVPGTSGSGGGGGALVMAIASVTPGTVYALTVGAGGSAGAAGSSGTSAGSGGQSKFGTVVIADGGIGGAQPVSDSYKRTPKSGGSGGKSARYLLTKGIITFEEAGASGDSGSSYTSDSEGGYITPTGGSGGKGHLTYGAGGSGGNGSSANTGNPGSAGSAGYAYLFW